MLLKIKSKQGNARDEFLHANMEEGENIYVKITRVFKKKGKGLKLCKNIHGL